MERLMARWSAFIENRKTVKMAIRNLEKTGLSDPNSRTRQLMADEGYVRLTPIVPSSIGDIIPELGWQGCSLSTCQPIIKALQKRYPEFNFTQEEDDICRIIVKPK